MERTSRLLAALALGLALAGVTAAAAVAQPTPPTIEDHHDPLLRIQTAEEARGAQPDATLTEAEQRRIARVRPTWVLTVCSATTRSWAISALERPRATQGQHLGLAFGELLDLVPARRPRRAGPGERPQQPAGHRGRQHRLPGRHHPYRLGQVLGG